MLGMITHICNPSTSEVEAEDQFNANLGQMRLFYFVFTF